MTFIEKIQTQLARIFGNEFESANEAETLERLESIDSIEAMTLRLADQETALSGQSESITSQASRIEELMTEISNLEQSNTSAIDGLKIDFSSQIEAVKKEFGEELNAIKLASKSSKDAGTPGLPKAKTNSEKSVVDGSFLIDGIKGRRLATR